MKTLIIVFILCFTSASQAQWKRTSHPQNTHLQYQSCLKNDNKCQSSITRVINQSVLELVIFNYNFDNQKINQSIFEGIERNLLTIIIVDPVKIGNYLFLLNNWANRKNVQIYFDRNHDMKEQVIIIDNIVTFRGEIDKTLRTDFYDVNHTPIKILKGQTLAGISKNQFQLHINHSAKVELTTN